MSGYRDMDGDDTGMTVGTWVLLDTDMHGVLGTITETDGYVATVRWADGTTLRHGHEELVNQDDLRVQLAGYVAAVSTNAPASVVDRYNARLTVIGDAYVTAINTDLRNAVGDVLYPRYALKPPAELPAVGTHVTFKWWSHDDAGSRFEGVVVRYWRGVSGTDMVDIKRDGYRETASISVARFMEWRVIETGRAAIRATARANGWGISPAQITDTFTRGTETVRVGYQGGQHDRDYQTFCDVVTVTRTGDVARAYDESTAIDRLTSTELEPMDYGYGDEAYSTADDNGIEN